MSMTPNTLSLSSNVFLRCWWDGRRGQVDVRRRGDLLAGALPLPTKKRAGMLTVLPRGRR